MLLNMGNLDFSVKKMFFISMLQKMRNWKLNKLHFYLVLVGKEKRNFVRKDGCEFVCGWEKTEAFGKLFRIYF